MKKLLIPAVIAVAVLCSVGCGTTAKFVYPYEPKNLVQLADSPLYSVKIAVQPFDEQRPANNEDFSFLCFLPLMPYGWGDYERPDAASSFLTIGGFDVTPSEDLAKAAAYSLRKSGLFQEAYFTYGGDNIQSDYCLEGEIHQFHYMGRKWLYGFSFYGHVVWAFGAPSGSSENDIKVTLKLRDVKTQKIIWKKEFERHWRKQQNMLYYSSGHDCMGFSDMFQDIMNESIPQIRNAITSLSLARKNSL